MAFKSAKKDTNKAVGGSRTNKPLVKEYQRLHKDNPALWTATHSVHTVRITNGGEWVMLETDEFNCLVPIDTDDGQFFTDLIQKLEGVKYALVVVPQRGKLGFDYGVDDEVSMYWVTGAEGYLHAYPPEMYDHLGKTAGTTLKLSDFDIPEVLAALEDDRKVMEKNARAQAKGGGK